MAHTITKRYTNKGIAFDLYYRWNGQRYRPLLGYDLSQAEAQQRAVELIYKIQTQQIEKARSPFTLHDVLPLFWQAFEVKKRLDRRRPEGILRNHILSCHRCLESGFACRHRFGHRSLSSITPEDGLQYVTARLDEGATAGTVRREWQVLNRVLNVAVRYEKLDRNPLKDVELPDTDKRTRVADPAELELIRKMKENDPTKRDCRQELWRIIQIRRECGLTRGQDPFDRAVLDQKTRRRLLAVSAAGSYQDQRQPQGSATKPYSLACVGRRCAFATRRSSLSSLDPPAGV